MSTTGPVLTPDAGPTRPMASRARCGLRVGPVWHYRQVVDGGATPIHGPFDVAPDTVFELAVFPDLEHDSTSNASPPPNFDGCFLAVDFTTPQGRMRLVDQHLHPVDGRRGCLVADNWNLWQLDLSPLVGTRIESVELASGVGRTGSGWLQVFGVTDRPTEEPDVVDRVRTTRGTHSAFLYSRGNALPLTCVPQGFNFLVPLTESRDRNWLYGYHRDGGPRPRLQALAFSHQPSPWIADRSAFQIMPWQGEPTVYPDRRARAFSHTDELDRPHHYRVALEGGITAEMTPTSRAGLFRFEWSDPGRHGVVLDQPYLGLVKCETLDDGRVAFHAAIAPQSGWTSGLHRPQPPAYVYGETRQPAMIRSAWERRSPLEGLSVRGRRLHKSWFGRFTLPLPRPQAAVLETDSDVLECQIAMSFISVDQARRNLRLEIGDASFDEIADRAHDTWLDLLGRLEIDGGTLDERVTAWSNLAALYSWPNEHHEFLGTPDPPRQGYASPFAKAGRHGLHTTGCQILDGTLYVNNGYWDTYRTCWPAYSLLTPERAPELLDGILQQYRDGGWMARWSAPGYVDCMVGTSSDAIFADASAQGTFPDLATELEAYDSAMRNALGPSGDPMTGRKAIGRARFRGYVDTDEPEGLSWTLDNASCDGAIALWSRRLAERAASGDAALSSRQGEFHANSRWFTNRSLSHAVMFDARVGFYRGRRPDGSFRPLEGFDPAVWGHDYTETNAWGQAFHAPHDGAGLASLLGGEAALAA
ncbi:MAG TPA: glycoside hydrolase domain-containing protein, partial [Propionibacteriaceae bacterium]|nr:glycoside hydrolase domain-containing protein [Propionibacteriaceae bacterium]